MSVIKCELQDQYMVITDNPVISAGDVNTDSIVFTLDSNWNLGNVTYFALFLIGSLTLETELSESDSVYSCNIPNECTAEKGLFSFSILARNANKDIVKTSAIRTYAVTDGTNGGAVPVVDWLKFKRDLVDQLNEQFDLGLTYDSTTDEILAAISTIKDGAAVTQFFIDLLNSQLGLQLSYDDSEETITTVVTAAVEALKEIEENYNYLVDGLLAVVRSDNNG